MAASSLKRHTLFWLTLSEHHLGDTKRSTRGNMAQQGGNQNLPPSNLCRMGCGFYGNPMYDGMCSKCHKDALKRRQQASSPTQMSGRISPLTTVCSSSVAETCSTKSTTDSITHVLETSVASVETGSPTVTTSLLQDKGKTDTEKEQDTDCAATSASCSNDTNSSDPDRKPKKNRCHTCKKKVGLTGFACRCGGLYCGMHRYSDKHDCSFNYKELAQEEIRKSNPVIVAEKIQKI